MITINRSPNQEINAANSDVLYVVTSNSSSLGTFKYVVDLIETPGSYPDDLITSLKQSPNPSGIGVFNLGRVVLNKISGDPFYTTNMFQRAVNSINRYQIYFGEEYGSPLERYDGNGNTGDPAVSASDGSTYTYFINATLNRNVSRDANFNTASFYGSDAQVLTDIPRTDICIQENENYVMAMLNGPTKSGSAEFNDVYKTEFEFFDSTNSSLGTETFINAQGGTDAASSDSLRLLVTTPYSTIEPNFFANNLFKARLTYIQVGPGNVTLPANTTSYTVKIQDSGSITYETLSFKICEPDCVWPTYRLMWQNSYGVYDCYSFTGKNTYKNTRTDSQYGRGFIDYSIPVAPRNPYNISSRGNKNYFTERKQTVTVSTQFLTQEWADWLEGLFMSPDVYLIGDDDVIIPINLTTAEYRQLNDKRNEKLKSYTIEFEYANPQRPY